jgi:hypothetical protein
MTQFFQGMGNGFLAMFGMGQLYDPLADASSEMKSIVQKTNELTSINSLKSSQNLVTGLSKLLDLNRITDKKNQLLHDQTNQFISDSLQRENLFIMFLYILFFIFISFFLAQKKCC